jgi:hypothetical protein
MKKIIFGCAIVLAFFSAPCLKAQDDSEVKSKPSPGHMDLTFSFPHRIGEVDNAGNIFGPNAGNYDFSDTLWSDFNFDYYFFTDFLMGLGYKTTTKVVGYRPGGPSYTLDMRLDGFLLRFRKRIVLSNSFDLDFFVNPGLYGLSGTETDFYVSASKMNTLSGSGFGVDMGTCLYLHLGTGFALGFGGGYQYAPISPVTMSGSSLAVKSATTNGGNVLNADGSVATIDYSGLYFNFLTFRATFH